MPLEARDAASLADMLGFAREAATFCAGRTRADFDTDPVFFRAIERCLELIGEAASRVSSVGRQTHPGIPWQMIVGMRNILAHDYGHIDAGVVWDTVQRRIPGLIASLEAIVEAPPPS